MNGDHRWRELIRNVYEQVTPEEIEPALNQCPLCGEWSARSPHLRQGLPTDCPMTPRCDR